MAKEKQREKHHLSIVVPVYNEENAIVQTFADLKEVCKNLNRQNISTEIIAVNDGSKDKSLKVLRSIEGINVINNPYNLGYGSSLKRGIRESSGKWICITDADGTYPNKDIPKLMKFANSYDMVVGARVGKHVKIPLIRRPPKWILGLLANFLTGKKIPDLNSGLRIFRREIADEFWNLFPQRFSFTVTITLACLTSGYPVKYVPINYFHRKGESSMGPWNFVSFINLMFRIIMYFRPLKFFLVPSLSLLFLGLVWAIFGVVVEHNITDSSLFIFLTGMLLTYLGFVAELIARKR